MERPVTLENIIDFLLETPLFDGLDPTELAEVVRIMQVQRVRDGQTIFREGDPGDAWYVVFTGEVAVSKSSSFGPERCIAALSPHACFGEMAILDDGTRSASVRSRGEATVFRFPRESFGSLIEQGNPGAYKLILAMSRVLSHRLRHLTQQVSDLVGDGSVVAREVEHSLGSLLDSYTVSE